MASLSAVTVIWSMTGAACLTLAAVHVLVWVRDRARRANLFFALAAGSIGIFAFIELLLMRAETIDAFASLHRIGHTVIFVTLVSIVGFVQTYLGTGRPWLGWTIVGLRTVVVVLAWAVPPTFHYSEIAALVPTGFLGETIVVPDATPTPWARLGESSALLTLVFVVDAAVRLWRRGDPSERRRAGVIGGSFCVCLVIAVTGAFLVHAGRVQAPYFVSGSFLVVVAAMASELSRDLIGAARMARELSESEQRMTLASEAANIGLWVWDVEHDTIWATDRARVIYGLGSDVPVDLARFLSRVHPDDRSAVALEVERAMEGAGAYHAEYRVPLPGRPDRWVVARGRVELTPGGRPCRLHGVSIDVTDQRAAEAESRELRASLAHTDRVNLLGQLASALAHELSQPLGAILRNAEAAAMLLEAPTPDLDELRAVVADIRSDDRRAGAVIAGLRSLLERRVLEPVPLDIDEVITEVVALVRPDAALRRIVVAFQPGSTAPRALGDRVHLQQVLLNLIVNAMDAIDGDREGGAERRVVVSAAKGSENRALVAVTDDGPGLPSCAEDRLFEPFFTTKAHGMGMGLPVCRTIIESHGGRIWAENRPDPERGAIVRFTVSAAAPAAHDHG